MSVLKDKIALVTGGNSGIGYATAKNLKAQGAEVVITGRNEDKVSQAAEELGVTGLVADVSDINALNDLVEQFKSIHQHLDILFVNAGVFLAAPVGQTSEEMFDQVMDINFKGAVFTIEKFLPLIKEGGSIINLSSINAFSGMPNTTIYSASKAAMNAYTRTASVELSPRNIRINAVNPGPISTPIFGKTGMPEEQINTFAEAVRQSVPLKRFGEPEEVAKLVTFLASDDAGYITGAEFNIDGGRGVNSFVG